MGSISVHLRSATMYTRTRRELLAYLGEDSGSDDPGPPPGAEVGAGPPGLGPRQEIEKVCTTVPVISGIMYVKYFYEPAQTWFDIDISGDKTIAELMCTIFRQWFPDDVELKCMDALQIHYTKHFVNID